MLSSVHMDMDMDALFPLSLETQVLPLDPPPLTFDSHVNEGRRVVKKKRPSGERRRRSDNTEVRVDREKRDRE